MPVKRKGRKAVYMPLIYRAVETLTINDAMTKAEAFQYIRDHKAEFAGLQDMKEHPKLLDSITASYYRWMGISRGMGKCQK